MTDRPNVAGCHSTACEALSSLLLCRCFGNLSMTALRFRAVIVLHPAVMNLSATCHQCEHMFVAGRTTQLPEYKGSMIQVLG